VTENKPHEHAKPHWTQAWNTTFVAVEGEMSGRMAGRGSGDVVLKPHCRGEVDALDSPQRILDHVEDRPLKQQILSLPRFSGHLV
jgi:hypothetical protein